MDLKEIKIIVDLMKRSDLTEFQIEEKDLKLKICRRGEAPAMVTHTVPVAPAPIATAPAVATPVALSTEKKTPANDPSSKIIKSPMVGTFYRAASPDSKPFVDINSTVKSETVVCIIEAMKVMNEIQAEVQGTIVEILVENGEAVEYGQPLFRVKV